MSTSDIVQNTITKKQLANLDKILSFPFAGAKPLDKPTK